MCFMITFYTFATKKVYHRVPLLWKWSTPTEANRRKIAQYFGVSLDELMSNQRPVYNDENTKDEDLMFALFGSHEEITEEMLEDVKAYARFKLEQKKRGQ